MITSLRLIDFKNFADETLRVGPFTVIVGANASGKSNIRDAFRFLHGIGRGYTLAEILGGKFGNRRQEEWERIRGGHQIARHGKASFRLELVMSLEGDDANYAIEVASEPAFGGAYHVTGEELSIRSREIFKSIGKTRSDLADEAVFDPFALGAPSPLLVRVAPIDDKDTETRISVKRSVPVLTQIPKRKAVAEVQRDRAEQVLDILGNMRFLELDPYMMRQPVLPSQTTLTDSGANLPAVLRAICADRQRKRTLMGWIRGLTPTDVQDFEFPVDAINGRVQLVVREEDERRFAADSTSDGTLRFLGLLAAMFGVTPASLYFFEDIDDGLHPSRLRLLLELLERETGRCPIQVVTTTHSPDLLAQANDRTFEDMSLVCRREDSANTVIRPVTQLPNAGQLRRSQGLGRLHATGWMEDMIAFEGDDEDSPE